MRAAMIPALIIACGGPQQAPPPIRTIAGRVIDETGAPVANAEVLVCAGSCESELRDSVIKAQSLQKSLGEGAESWHVLFAYSRTTIDGAFRVSLPRIVGFDRSM